MLNNESITLYNVYYNGTKEVYVRKHIPEALVVPTNEAMRRATGGNLPDHSVQIHIPIAPHLENFYTPKEWLGLVDKTVGFTLSNDTLLVLGKVTQELSDVFTPTMLRETGIEVYKLLLISDFRGGSKALWNWKVIAG